MQDGTSHFHNATSQSKLSNSDQSDPNCRLLQAVILDNQDRFTELAQEIKQRNEVVSDSKGDLIAETDQSTMLSKGILQLAMRLVNNFVHGYVVPTQLLPMLQHFIYTIQLLYTVCKRKLMIKLLKLYSKNPTIIRRKSFACTNLTCYASIHSVQIIPLGLTIMYVC